MILNGLKKEPIPIRNYSFDICCKTTTDTLPDEYELPQELLPPVENQFNTSKCAAFSACSCASSQSIKDGQYVRYSPSFIYARTECRGNYKAEGMFPSFLMKGLLKTGFVPYTYFQFDNDEVPELIDKADARDDLLEFGKDMKPSAFVAMNSAMIDKRWDDIRRAIYEYQCPVFICSDNYFRGGGHAIFAYGWTNKSGKRLGRYLKFQNSWGEDWDTDGRSEIPIDYIDEAYMFCWEDIKLPFDDVKETDWFYDDVRSVYLSGLISGTSATTFEPNAPLIRGDVAVILSRLLNEIEFSMNAFIKTKRQEGKSIPSLTFKKSTEVAFPFVDVYADDYYKDAIHHVYANGIMTGISNTEFAPTATMTRAEAATIVTRVFQKLYNLLSSTITASYKLPFIGIADFSDVERDDWYYDYIANAYRYGLMEGNNDGTFAPENDIVRCEGAAIFHRLFKAIENLMAQAV